MNPDERATNEPWTVERTAGRGFDAVAVPNLLMVDLQGRVVVAGGTDIWATAGVHVCVGDLVPSTLRDVIDSALQVWANLETTLRCVRVALWPGIAVSIYEVHGGDAQRLIALLAQPFRARTNLRHAQQAYGLSPRELDILRHVLRGLATTQIAATLSIADSTVIAHVKSLLVKTRAANRAALVARVLGWDETVAQ